MRPAPELWRAGGSRGLAAELAEEGLELEAGQDEDSEGPAWFSLRALRRATPEDFLHQALGLFERVAEAEGEIVGFELPAAGDP